LSLLVILLILYPPEWEALKTCIRRPSTCAVILSLTLVLNILLAPLKMQAILLQLGHKLSFIEALRLRSRYFFSKNILPFRTGDVLFTVYLHKSMDVSLSAGFGLSVCMIATSFLSWLVLGLISVLGFKYSLLALSIFGALIIAIPTFRCEVKPSGEGVVPFVLNILNMFSTRAGRVHIIGSSLSCALTQFLILFALLKSFLCLGDPQLFWAKAGACFFLAALPISVGGLGTRELAIVEMFSGTCPPAKLMTVALIFTFTIVVIPGIVSLFFMTLSVLKSRQKRVSLPPDR